MYNSQIPNFQLLVSQKNSKYQLKARLLFPEYPVKESISLLTDLWFTNSNSYICAAKIPFYRAHRTISSFVHKSMLIKLQIILCFVIYFTTMMLVYLLHIPNQEEEQSHLEKKQCASQLHMTVQSTWNFM